MSNGMENNDDSIVYDRQIRLWGVEAQRRLGRSKVLFSGLSGTSVECVKNVVLAGVGSVTLMDCNTVTINHLRTNFFVNSDHIGQNIAEASLHACQELNPFVKVEAKNFNILFCSIDFLKEFSCIIVSQFHISLVAELNKKCRTAGVKLFGIFSMGFFSVFFTDLLHHECLLSNESQEAATTEKSRKSISFNSFNEILNSDWQKYVRMAVLTSRISAQVIQKRIATSFSFLIMIDKWLLLNPKISPPLSQELWLEFSQFAVDYLNANNLCDVVDLDLLKENYLNYTGEFIAVCAIIGGVLSNEIIKAVSFKNTPIHSLFFLDAIAGTGVVSDFGLDVHTKCLDENNIYVVPGTITGSVCIDD